jgi:hypothetical protein
VTPLKAFNYPQQLADGATFGGTWNAGSTQEWTGADGDKLGMNYLASLTAPQLYKLSFTTAPVVSPATASSASSCDCPGS